MRGDQDPNTPVSRAVPTMLRALSGMYLCPLHLKYILVLPLQGIQRGIFSSFFPVPSCTGYCFISGCFFYLLYSDFLFPVFIFTDQQRPDQARPPAVLLCDTACELPHLVYFFPLSWSIHSQGETGGKGAGWDHAFPFPQSFLSALPISIFPPGTCSVGLKTAVVYS